jgi:hypothetical protein
MQDTTPSLHYLISCRLTNRTTCHHPHETVEEREDEPKRREFWRLLERVVLIFRALLLLLYVSEKIDGRPAK